MEKILMVEDSALECELLIEILRGSGVKHEFLQARDGEEGLKTLAKNYKEISLILLDWQMPQMSGLEFMAGVIKVPVTAAIPIIMVTASGSENDKRRAREVNPSLAGYVVKPYTPEHLLETINPFLKTKGGDSNG